MAAEQEQWNEGAVGANINPNPPDALATPSAMPLGAALRLVFQEAAQSKLARPIPIMTPEALAKQV